jgi:hypothetical protein
MTPGEILLWMVGGELVGLGILFLILKVYFDRFYRR